MRVWSQGFPGLVLSLAPAWYALPTHIEGRERRRLLELLAAGHEDIDHVAELEWPLAKPVIDRLELQRSLVLLSVPAGGETAEEVLVAVRAQLGRVRLGLVQHEQPDTWPELSWLEREVKSPLLDWLDPQLHDPGHPLARLGLAELPLHEIARVTPEPVELLELLDMLVDRRLRFGDGSGDWSDSVAQVIAERFARRVARVPVADRAGALEMVVIHHDDPVVARDQLGGPAVALAHAGLAAIWGADVTLGPLAQAAGKREMLPRLLRLLPAAWWSPVSRAELTKALPVLAHVPRANLVAPEPAYSRLPAVMPEPPEGVLDLDLELGDRKAHLLAWLGRPRQVSLFSFALHPVLLELDDALRFELDVEQGRIARFDALDRELDAGDPARAYLRWLALTYLLGRADTIEALELLERERERAHTSTLEPGLDAAFWALRGDLAARRGDYLLARSSWTEARSRLPYADRGADQLLSLRQSLVELRLELANEAASSFVSIDLEDVDYGDATQRALGFVQLSIIAHLVDLQVHWAQRLGSKPPGVPQSLDMLADSLRRFLDQSLWRAAELDLVRAAICLETSDWPGAIEVLERLDKDLDTPTGRRALLLDATVSAVLGDHESGASDLRALCKRCTRTHDPLVEALALRGLAAVIPAATTAAGLDQASVQQARQSLDRALEIERELGLPDAEILALERAGWAVLGGQPGSVFQAALDRVPAAGAPALAAASMQVQLRVIFMLIAAARASRTLPDQTLIDGLVGLAPEGDEGRGFGPWFDLAVEHLLAIAADQLEAGRSDAVRTLLDRIRPLVTSRHQSEFKHTWQRAVGR